MLCSNLELRLNGLSSQLLEKENSCQILEIEKINISTQLQRTIEASKTEIKALEEY